MSSAGAHKLAPAFPIRDLNEHPGPLGMTLRDWFAGCALMGANASPELMQIITSAEIADGSYFDRLAPTLYRQADAMLKAREA